ncbi:MAG TPA: hypothetical protein VFA27_11015 [Vicinamibacterales bacterium]|nr:hypothetical protein [Vicinamibacterales bacterium]
MPPFRFATSTPWLSRLLKPLTPARRTCTSSGTRRPTACVRRTSRRRLRASRQATNYLLAQLEAMGYLERRSGPGEARRRIHVTARGRRLLAAMAASMRRFERQCRRRVGAARYRAFRHVLDAIAARAGVEGLIAIPATR